MSGKVMRKQKRFHWLQKEVDTLLDQAIIYMVMGNPLKFFYFISLF